MSAAATCPRTTSRPATATATLTVNRGDTATTGQDEIDGTASPPANNDAHPGNSVEQGTVNVDRQPLPTPPPAPASPEITTWAATATSAIGGISTGETAETDDIYATAGLPADNDATPVTSVEQGAVNVHARLCRSLSCHIALGGKASWGKSPRQTSCGLPTDRIFG
ncbi:MAG: hypothetical protein M1826_006576 [Phylliscum demangeonii]|nr:MAG: hypothetical protein M1826_006576 [Phylliscum demangeonii]